MGRILLTGMRFKSYIGVYAFEQKRGNEFEVDIQFDSDLISGNSDDLANTIDYALVYEIAKEVMDQRCHLIEFAARRILEKAVARFPVDYVKVRITKLNPPLEGEVMRVSAEMVWRR